MDKKTNFNLDKAISRIVKPSIFDRIVKEVDATEIPAKYIEQILVQFYDGTIIELSGEDITHPIPMAKNANIEALKDGFNKMRDVRVFIATDRLEKDIDILVEDYLGKYC